MTVGYTAPMQLLIEYLQNPENSQVKLAKTIGVTQPAVARWVERRKVPAERVLDVSRATGIAPSHLRPDIYPDT